MAKATEAPRDIVSIEALEEGLGIDEHSLDKAWLQQPDYFYRVAKQLALMTSRRDAKKQELAEVEARADADIRTTAANRKEKTTEAEIKASVRIDNDVLKVTKELSGMSLYVGQLGALERAYEMRSKALTKLVDLHIASYYRSGDGSPSRASQRALGGREASEARDKLKVRRERYGDGNDD